MNLSSDDESEEEGFDGWANVNLRESITTSNRNCEDDSDEDGDSFVDYGEDGCKQQAAATVAFFGQEDENKNHDDGEEEEEGIDWEDAVDDSDHGGEEEGDSKLAADNDIEGDKKRKHSNATLSSLKPVSFDWNKKENNKKSNKKKNWSRKKYRYETLPLSIRSLLSDLERTHLLSLTSHAMYVSRSCSDEELLHLSHSLALPEQYFMMMTTQNKMNKPIDEVEESIGCSKSERTNTFFAPTYSDLLHFCTWYFDLVNKIKERRREALRANYAAGAPANNPRPRRRNNKRQMASSTHSNGKKKPSAASVASDHKEVDSNITPVVGEGTITDRTRQFCTYLSCTFDEEPQLLQEENENCALYDWNDLDKVMLLVSMARSFGWRARYVMALEPLKKDLDVDHPLLYISRTKNILQQVWKNVRTKKVFKDDGGGKPPATRNGGSGDKENHMPKRTKQSQSLVDPTNVCDSVVWVEILCKTSSVVSKRRKVNVKKNGRRHESTKMRWIHVDPSRELLNQPDTLENILLSKREGSGFRNSKRKIPASYCLASEHLEVAKVLKCRLTDVTPRYASSWVETLKARGVLRGKQTRVDDDERVDLWWNQALKCFDDAEGKAKGVQATKHPPMGNSAEDAIVVDDEFNDKAVQSEMFSEQRTAGDQVEDHEKEELSASIRSEPIPTSKTGFKSHPTYVIPSVLNNNEVLLPSSRSRICGVFKGEMVYYRTDVRVALPAKRWLYKGRKVKETELRRPIKRIKGRRKPVSKTFKALKSYGVGESNDGSENHRFNQLEIASQPLEDGMENIYAPWQTEPWNPPPVSPEEPIPVNEHNNVEYDLLNPGLVHVDEPRIAVVAKKLGIPYAPCLLGFEGRGGNRTPTIRGIVVHQTNEMLLRDAHVELTSKFLEENHSNRRQAVYGRWKKLMVAVLTRDRIEREYGNCD